MSICKTAFSITPLHEKAYDLNIKFLDKDSHALSDKTFTFIEEFSLNEGTIWDVFTKNGVCKASLPFTKSDVKELNQAAKMLPNALSTPLVCVLDLKDPSTGYLPNSTIVACEEAVCSFFQNDTASKGSSAQSKKVHSLFKSSIPVDFVICEGHLKMDLLEQGGFTDKEIEYFQSTSSGKTSFCKTAEYFMNGFKLGDTGHVAGKSFPAHAYVKSISPKFNTFQPYKTSTVFYPALYKDMYSPNGEFAATLEPKFTSSGSFDAATEITTLTVEKK